MNDAARRRSTGAGKPPDRYRRIVDSMAAGVVVVGPDGTVEDLNPAARELLAPAGTPVEGARKVLQAPTGRSVEQRVTPVGGIPRTLLASGSETELDGHTNRIVSVHDVTELVKLRDELMELSLVDELTHLYNRRGFDQLARQQVGLASRARRAVILVFADVDGMKATNDRFGHPAGDELLVAVAVVLRSCFRQTDVLARVGGDEFAAVAIDAAVASGDVIEDRIAKKVREWNEASSKPYRMSLSVGAAAFDPEAPCTVEDLVALADLRMYERKRTR